MIHDVLSGRAPGGYAYGVQRRTDRATTDVQLASAERDVTGSLSVVTKEGDTVTLSASFDSTVTYANVRRGREHAGAVSAQVSRSFSLQIDGSLSDQEIRDIRQVVKRFMQDLRSMVRGGQPLLSNVTEVDASTLRSITASSSTQDTVVAAAIDDRPRMLPSPAAPAAPETEPNGGAQRAPLLAEDTPSAPPAVPALPARGFVSPHPPTLVISRLHRATQG